VNTLLAVCVTTLLLAVPTGQASSSRGQTFVVFLCGKTYANLCGVVPETGAVTKLTLNGVPHRTGSREYRLFHRNYRSPSLSADGKVLAFGFDGKAFVAPQAAQARKALGDSKKLGLVSVRRDGRRFALIERALICRRGSCRRRGTLVVRTRTGQALRRVPNVWDADWAGRDLLVSRSPRRLLLLSAPSYGRALARIERRPWSLHEPAVSPNGRLVAVRIHTRRGSSIAVFSLRTRKLVRRLTSGPADSDPEWSPDGKQVVFSRHAGSCDERGPCGELFVVRADGRGQPRSLVVQGTDPTWGLRVR
jgi:hypothetical protein